MIAEELGIDYEQAHHLLLIHGSVKDTIDFYRKENNL